jgi:hypothetical protein
MFICAHVEIRQRGQDELLIWLCCEERGVRRVKKGKECKVGRVELREHARGPKENRL